MSPYTAWSPDEGHVPGVAVGNAGSESNGALRTIVARLRQTVGVDALVTTATGYRLDLPVDAVFACEELERANGDPAVIRGALDRWVGRALDEFRDEAWAHGEATRLAEVHANAVENLADALVARRRSNEAITILEPHILDNEFRDRPRGLLMRSLAAAGRQTEALRSYQTYRSFLVERAGTEPSEELRRIEQRIATGWDAAMASSNDQEGGATGPGADQARAAAIKETGGTVNAVERDGENGATWEVEVTRPDWSTIAHR